MRRRTAALATLAVAGCFSDAVLLEDAGSTGSESGDTHTITPATTVGATATTAPPPGSTGGSAGGGSDDSDDAVASSSSSTSDGSDSEGSSGDDGGSSSGGSPTGEPDTPYGDCYGDGGTLLCPTQSCILDVGLPASACAPDCDPGCDEGGTCADAVTDQAVAPVCILLCDEADDCPGGVCGDTGWTNGGAPLLACMWL